MYLDKTKRAELYTQFGHNAQDSGTAESQIAQFSFRIAHLTEHLRKTKRTIPPSFPSSKWSESAGIYSIT